MKISKREATSMMVTLSKWEAFRNEHIKIIDKNYASSETESVQNDVKKPKYLNATHVAVQVVKARLLDLRNNQEKAEKELNEQYIKELSPSLYYNNLGVIEFHRKNYQQAALLFYAAYEENLKLKTSFKHPYILISTLKFLAFLCSPKDFLVKKFFY